jgi:hypothetical protein
MPLAGARRFGRRRRLGCGRGLRRRGCGGNRGPRGRGLCLTRREGVGLLKHDQRDERGNGQGAESEDDSFDPRLRHSISVTWVPAITLAAAPLGGALVDASRLSNHRSLAVCGSMMELALKRDSCQGAARLRLISTFSNLLRGLSKSGVNVRGMRGPDRRDLRLSSCFCTAWVARADDRDD